MYGLGKNDAMQVDAVEKFKISMAELRGGYVYPGRWGEKPVLLTGVQRDILVEIYAKFLNRAMWLTMIVTLVGLVGLGVISIAFNLEQHFWMVLPIVALALLPTFTIRPLLRRNVEEFGLLPTVSPAEYSVLRQEWLRATPWSTFLLPGLLLPFLAWRMHPQVPPSGADDWVKAALLIGLLGLLVWATTRKLLAGSSAES